MNFRNKAFEKAYLQIIRESAGEQAEVCPDCGQAIEYDEQGNPICACSAEGESFEEDDEAEEDADIEECDEVEEDDESEEDADIEECDEVEEDDESEEDADIEECDEVEEDDESEEDADIEEDDEVEEDDDADAEEVPAEDEAAAEGDDAAGEDAPSGKFISFFTTDPDLIAAFQDGFAKVAVTGNDKDAEPVEFVADLFENLSVEDLKDDEEADAEGDVEADVDADAAAEDEAAETEEK